MNTKKDYKARAVSHVTPAPGRVLHRMHGHNHIIRVGIRQPWTAVYEHDTLK